VPQTAAVSTPIEPTEITTGHLVLRPWRPADAHAVFAACQDPELQRWTRVPVPYRHEDAVHYVGQLSPQAWAAGTAAHFAVLDAVTGDLQGSVSLMDLAEGGAEVGYWTAVEARGRGRTTEAVRAVCAWGVGALGLQRITWLAHVGNTASRRVAEKAGFVVEGTLRQYLPHRGERRDAWVGGLLPGDLGLR